MHRSSTRRRRYGSKHALHYPGSGSREIVNQLPNQLDNNELVIGRRLLQASQPNQVD